MAAAIPRQSGSLLGLAPPRVPGSFRGSLLTLNVYFYRILLLRILLSLDFRPTLVIVDLR